MKTISVKFVYSIFIIHKKEIGYVPMEYKYIQLLTPYLRLIIE